MEYPQGAESFNAKTRISSPEFRMLVEEAEREINVAALYTDSIDDLIEDHEDIMEQSIGDDCYAHEAIFSGFVFQTDENEEPTEIEDYISTNECVFHAMRLVMIGKTYKVVLQISTDDYFDENDVLNPRELYYALPESVETFEILVEEPVMDVIARHAINGMDIVTERDFYNLSFEDQKSILEEAAFRLDFDLPFLEHFGVAFDASRYIVVPDGMQGDISNYLVDQSMLDSEDRVQPKGEYVECIYAELAYQTKAFRRIAELNLGRGVACIVLRNDELGVFYFVPLDAIENHDNTYLSFQDQMGQE